MVVCKSFKYGDVMLIVLAFFTFEIVGIVMKCGKKQAISGIF